MGTNAQINVDSNGNVGLHTTSTSSTSNVYLYGNMQFANNLGPFLDINYYYSEPRITPATATTGYLGTSTLPFQFLYCYYVKGYALYTTYTTLHASDKKLKENFRSIDNPLEKILKMDGKEYDYISDRFDTIGTDAEKKEKTALKKNKLGFIAQEVKEIVPEAVMYKEDEDLYYIDYDAIIPVIVEAMKEQQAKIETLEAEIEALNGGTVKEKSATLGNNSESTETAVLSQNTPNPFTANTTISMYLPATVSKAILYIYNMQGTQIQNITIQERGNTSVIVEGGSLDAGMYLYTLIADGKEVDTKKMILTR